MGFVLEIPGTLTITAEVLMWTLGVKINWIARGVLNDGDQANVLMPNFDNARKLPQKELEIEYVCSCIQLLKSIS